MAISFEQMQALLQQQQKLIETLTEKLTLQATASSMADQSRPLVDAIAQTISEFQYDPNGGVYFDAWFRKYEDTFRVELAQADDAHKVRILLRKLGPAEHERYTNFILPKNPREFSFDETVNYLSQIFGEQSSLFKIRYQCLKLVKNEADDFITYAGIVNRESERFKLRTMTDDQFKALIFVCGLQSPTDADVRSRILNMMELDPDMTLQSITSECQRLLNLKSDAQMIVNQSGSSQVNVMHAPHSRSTRKLFSNSTRSNSKPPTACWKCGQWHYVRLCPFKRHLCQKCLKRGHKEECCQGSERNKAKRTTRSKYPQSPRKRIESNSVSATFKVDFASRRKFVTLSINNVPVRLQLDTASDITILSQKTWTLLGKPPVKPSNHTALTASGSTMKLIGELTCDVSFNDVSFKGLCYLTKSSRLNLLGLDWIEELRLFDVPLRTVCNNLRSKTHKTVEQHQRSPASDMEFIQREHAEIFRDELGCCTKTQAVKHLKPRSKPVFRPKRPVPYAAVSTAETELQRLQQTGVLKPVNCSCCAAPVAFVKNPKTLVSKNGTQFTSKIFAEFCKHNGIDHIRSPPYHPQSNGQAERCVDTFKRALLESKGEGTTSKILDKFLLSYRATPKQQTPCGVSPSEAFFGRQIRTPLDLFRPETRKSSERQQVGPKQDGTKKRLFNPGNTVLARDYRRQKPSWTLGIIRRRRQSYADPLQRGGVRSVHLLTKGVTLQRAKRAAKACLSNRQQLPSYWSIASQSDRTQDTSHTGHSGKKANRSIDVDTSARSIGHLGRT